jgi:outer membrane protein assembly factor BamA
LIRSGSFWHNARRTLLAAGVVLLSGGHTAAIAQSLRRVVDKPVVRELRIVGNTGLSNRELRAAIATQAAGSGWFGACHWLASGMCKSRLLDRAELDRDLLRLRVLYWKRGWRAAQVTPEITKVRQGQIALTLRVVEGPMTLVGSIELGRLDSMLTSHGIRRLLTIAPGDRLDLIALDTIAVQIAAHLDTEGFGDLVIKPTAAVDTTSPRGVVGFDVSGLYPTFVESVRVEGTENFDPRLVAITLGLKPGSVYSRSRAVESQRALYEAGFFKRAVVRVSAGSADSLKKLTAVVEELPVRAFRAVAGFSTVDFLQLDARFSDANVRNSAGRVSIQGTVGNLFANQLNGQIPFNNVLPTSLPRDSSRRYLDPTFQINADYRRRWLSDSRNQTGVSVFGYRRSSPGVFVDQGGGAAASFTRNVTRTVPVSLQYRLEFTNVSAADTYFCVNFGVCDAVGLSVLTKSQRLAPLALTAASDRRDDPIGPTTGYTWRTEIEAADTWTGSQFRYGRIEVEGSKYFHASEKLTVAVHARGGFVRGGNRTIGRTSAPIVLPRKRFYAGGARSVRGYGENQLGPRVLVIPRAVLQPDTTTFNLYERDDRLNDGRLPCRPERALPTCPTSNDSLPGETRPRSNFVDGDFTPKPLGAETLVEGSIEARYRLFSRFTVAAFVDAGSVGARFGGTATVYTPGVGIRFLSPIGPIRMDLGYNPRASENLSVITELAPRDIGAAWNTANSGIGLFRINETRAFNPATGTGLAGVFNRLTLHLGIGEAF